MLHTQSSHYDPTTKRNMTEITLHLDCGHKASFYGKPTDIENSAASLGVTVGSTGVSRCKECTRRYRETLKQVMASGIVGSRHE